MRCYELQEKYDLKNGCCDSCHEDYADYGDDYCCSVLIDDRWVDCCCTVYSELQALGVVC